MSKVIQLGGGASLDEIYPVGSIYISVGSTSPATLFGGTWDKIEGKFLLSSSSSYTLNSTGGEATHKLTVAEMPSHSHDLYIHKGGNTSLVGVWGVENAIEDKKLTGGSTWGIQNSGNGTAHNNMPPYLVVNVWKRTK